MKQSAKIITAVFLFGTALCTNTFAQQPIASAEPDYSKSNSEALTGNTKTAVPAAKTEASFAALFPQATNPFWASIGENCYYVSFLNNGRKANASFTAKGHLNYCITDCSMENLPASFSKALKKDYVGYTLLKGTEIKAYGTVAYQALLGSNTGFKTLKYTEDGVEEIEEMKKQ